MSNFEQFLGGSEKIGEVIPMVSSEMPYIFSASGGTYLRSGYTIPNSGLYNTYAGLTHTGTVILPDLGETVISSSCPLLKSGSNYINRKNYTTDLTTTWTAATGGGFVSIVTRSNFIVGTTIVATTSSNSVGMVDYSTDNGVTYTNVVGNNSYCYGAVNATGTLAMVIIGTAGTTAGHVYTSLDGITWTSRTPSIAVGTVYTLIWSPLLSAFVIRAANGTYSTTDGFTLTLLNATSAVSTNSASSTTSIVSVPFNTSTFSRTVDGITWTANTDFITGQTLYIVQNIYYVNGVYYATGSSSVVFRSVDDGLTWERFFISFDNTYVLGTSSISLGWVDAALYVSYSTNLLTSATLTVNGVMAKVKAEPTEGYAYVRIT